MDILLTGATGFIGGHLRMDLVKRHQLFALARHSSISHVDGLTWLTGDVSDAEVSCSLPDKMDAVVYLAQSRSYRQFPEAAEDIFSVNVRGTLSLLEYARRAGVHTFIFASSANVYRLSHQRISEDFPVELSSFYASTKRMAEMLVESYAQFFNCIILRLFTVYGPGQKEMLVPNLIERIQNGKPLQVQGKHGFKTSPVYVDDVIKVIQKLLERGKMSAGFEIFNVGGDEVFGIYELGLNIGEALSIVPHFDYTEEDEPLGWTADSSKLKATLKLNSFTSFADGIRQTI